MLSDLLILFSRIQSTNHVCPSPSLHERRKFSFPTFSPRRNRPLAINRSQSLNVRRVHARELSTGNGANLVFQEQVVSTDENSERKSSCVCNLTTTDKHRTQNVTSELPANRNCKWYCLQNKGIFKKFLLLSLCFTLGLLLAPVSVLVLMICCVSYFVPELK